MHCAWGEAGRARGSGRACERQRRWPPAAMHQASQPAAAYWEAFAGLEAVAHVAGRAGGREEETGRYIMGAEFGGGQQLLPVPASLSLTLLTSSRAG